MSTNLEVRLRAAMTARADLVTSADLRPAVVRQQRRSPRWVWVPALAAAVVVLVILLAWRLPQDARPTPAESPAPTPSACTLPSFEPQVGPGQTVWHDPGYVPLPPGYRLPGCGSPTQRPTTGEDEAFLTPTFVPRVVRAP